MRVPVRCRQHRQRRRAAAEALEGDVKLHVGGAVVHSSLQEVSARTIIHTRNPVGRPECRAGGLLGGEGRGEGVCAEELEHLVRCAGDRLGRISGV